jgi:hypothetical protein
LQFRDATFHADAWGGARHFTLSDIDQYIAETAMFAAIEADRDLRTFEIRDLLRSLDDEFAQLSNHFIYRTYKKYHWTFKNKSIKNKLKFTAQNIAYVSRVDLIALVMCERDWRAFRRWYGMYCDLIKDVPLNRLKFLDESHFASRGTFVTCVRVCTHTSISVCAAQSCVESEVLARKDSACMPPTTTV